MTDQSFCSPFCRARVTHVHNAIPADLAPVLHEAVARSGLPYSDVARRIFGIVAAEVRRRGRRAWTEGNGHGIIETDAFADHVINPARRGRGQSVGIAITLTVVQVLRACEQGTLEEALSSLERSSSPLRWRTQARG